jgi:hypothetical protein
VKTSGRNHADVHAIGAPQSWPTITACVAPSAPTSARLSPTIRTIRYASTSGGAEDRPYPRTSIATAR